MAGLFLALGLLLLLVVVGLAFYWQGSIRLPGAAIAYGVEDSIKYITPRLSEPTQKIIGARSVRRILEWEMKYLQEVLDSAEDRTVVLGGDRAVHYVLEQTARQGFDYEPAIVAEVLELQAEYMASIGAIAGPVADADRRDIEQREAGNG
ncbi:MAG: hypothetical protein QNJ77_02795 [Acidimicrobiia bacterium]|nr:hypothetical protein [Acidimicrobiia bacterium]